MLLLIILTVLVCLYIAWSVELRHVMQQLENERKEAYDNMRYKNELKLKKAKDYLLERAKHAQTKKADISRAA